MRICLILLMGIINATAATKDYSQKEAYEGCNGIADKDKKA